MRKSRFTEEQIIWKIKEQDTGFSAARTNAFRTDKSAVECNKQIPLHFRRVRHGLRSQFLGAGKACSKVPDLRRGPRCVSLRQPDSRT